MFILAAVIIMAIAAGVSAYSSIQQGKAQKEMYEYNAAAQAQAAKDEQEASASDAWKQAKMDDAEMAANRVYFNASGVRISEDDTPAISLVSQAGYRGMNVAAIRQRGASAASQQLAASKLSSFQGRVAQTASYYTAGTTLLSSAGQMVGSYALYNRMNTPPASQPSNPYNTT